MSLRMIAASVALRTFPAAASNSGHSGDCRYCGIEFRYAVSAAAGVILAGMAVSRSLMYRDRTTHALSRAECNGTRQTRKRATPPAAV
jgi:hypothetical protein